MTHRVDTEATEMQPTNRIAALALTTATLVSLSSGAAAATRTVTGNYCGDNHTAVLLSTAHVGTESCILKYSNGSTWVKLIPATADLAKDGYSSRAFIAVQQNVGGGGWKTSKTWTIINSQGVGNSVVGEVYQLNRAAGATHVKLLVTSCQYDAPTARSFNCATTTSIRGWGG